MPSKLPRVNVTFTKPGLYAKIERLAAAGNRSLSNEIITDLEEYFRWKEREAELFTEPRLREAGRVHAPVFETPVLPVPEPVSKPRAAPDREKS